MRRSPLSRKTPLVAKAGFTSREQLKKAQPVQRPPRKTGPTQETRQAVIARAFSRCERCGTVGAGNIHHRKPRGMGGSRDPGINSVCNLMLLCGSGTTGCHGWVESHRQDAMAEGWLVPRTADPAGAPVKIWGIGWVKLTAAGHYEKLRLPPTEEKHG